MRAVVRRDRQRGTPTQVLTLVAKLNGPEEQQVPGLSTEMRHQASSTFDTT